MNTVQTELDNITFSHDDTTLPDALGQKSPTNKYKYQEFESFAGERLLKSILRKILPLALFETWQVLAAENQANGNDAFLGIFKLAEYRQRSYRKIRMDLDDLKGRQLLAIRSEWKIFRQADGTIKSSPVAIKDFERLYDLAYEYLCWQDSEWYVPPERDYVELICENEPLLRKLIRFDNYRRLLCNKKPGPQAREKEIYQWYRTYNEAVPPLHEETQPCAEDAHGVEDDTREPKWKKYLKEPLKEPLKKASTKRVVTSNNTNQQERDSFDSAVCLEERAVAAEGYTKSTNSNHSAPHTEGTDGSLPPTNQTKSTHLPGFTSKKNGAKQATDEKPNTGERTGLETAVESAQKALAALQGRGGSASRKKMPPPQPNPLIHRFVREMSPVLHDENPKGSNTRCLRAVEQRNLTQKDIFACLVKAYVVARDTKKVHEKYRRSGGDLKMPLFCSMFERFAHDCADDRFHYDDEHLMQAIAADDRLRLFVDELKPEEMTLQIRDNENQSDQQIPATTSTPEQEGVFPTNVEPDVADQQQEEQDFINTDDFTRGWVRVVAERHADRFHDYLGKDFYLCQVLPTRCPGRYGFVIVERETGQEWVYLTTEDIDACINYRG